MLDLGRRFVPRASARTRSKAVLISEHRFARDFEGRVWTQVQGEYSSWLPYAQAFGSIQVLARASQVESPEPGYIRADGENVEFLVLPAYLGPWQFIKALVPLLLVTWRALNEATHVVLRGPGALSVLALPLVWVTRVPYAVEVLGDNREVFASGVGGRLHQLYGRLFSAAQERACWNAECVAYVTGGSLQTRYPNARGRQYAFSDVHLPEPAFVDSPRKYDDETPLNAILVGSLEQPYKGVDVALRAMVTGRKPWTLTVLGDGRLRSTYEDMAQQLGVRRRVRFAGAVAAGEEVREFLDASDLFIMPSLTEGMPRALIEAMARGLPALATNVGGIPELLPLNCLFRKGGAVELARLIEELSAKNLTRMSKENLLRAQSVAAVDMGARRDAFLKAFRACSYDDYEPSRGTF